MIRILIYSKGPKLKLFGDYHVVGSWADYKGIKNLC